MTDLYEYIREVLTLPIDEKEIILYRDVWGLNEVQAARRHGVTTEKAQRFYTVGKLRLKHEIH